MMRAIYRSPLFLVVLFALLLASCGASDKLKSGDILFQEKNYDLAAIAYKDEYQAEEVPQTKAEKAFKVGECYRLNADYKQAEKWYELSMKSGYDAIATYNYGLMLKQNEKYKQAIDQFTKYAREEPFQKELALNQIRQCTDAIKWQKERGSFAITNLSSINTPASEYGPVLLEDGSLLFTSDRFDATGSDTYGWTGERYSDIFLTKKVGDGFQGLIPFDQIVNSGANEGTPNISADGTELFFTRCGSQGKLDDYCAIYYSVKQTVGGWSSPVKLGFFSDTVNVGHPFLLKDGSALIFSADAEGGYGGNDLYISYFVDGYFDDPQNLGSTINSEGDELFPYIGADGTLYYASNGLPGLGGLDIFSARKEGTVWKDPENLKLPINSGYDDYAIQYIKQKPVDANDAVRQQGYFTSNRPGGSGKDDIYEFKVSNENLYVLEGVVLEKIFEDPKDPNSKVIDLQAVENADIVLKTYSAGLPVVGTGKSDKYGRFEFDLEKETNYYVSGNKDGYLKKSLDFSTKGLRDLKNILITVKVRLILEKIYEEREIVIPNIYYDFDKATLRPESELVLDSLYTMFVDNPDIVVEIGSHTDSRGKDDYNQTLSQARAKSVTDYLVSKGVNAERLKAVGYGETKLVNDCGNDSDCTEEEHQKNRRTTFKILSERFQLESIQPEDIRVDPKPGEK